MRLVLALVFLSCLIAGDAMASAHGGSKEKKPVEAAQVEEGNAAAGPRVPSVTMPSLVAPVVVNGELHHYVFLSVTIELTGDSYKSMMLEKIPYLQDAFLREVHTSSIAHDGDPSMLDETGLKARLLTTATATVGPNIVKAVDFKDAVRGSR